MQPPVMGADAIIHDSRMHYLHSITKHLICFQVSTGTHFWRFLGFWNLNLETWKPSDLQNRLLFLNMHVMYDESFPCHMIIIWICEVSKSAESRTWMGYKFLWYAFGMVCEQSYIKVPMARFAHFAHKLAFASWHTIRTCQGLCPRTPAFIHELNSHLI